MRRHRRHKEGVETALANFALTFAKALLVFCVLLFVLISPKTKNDDGIKPKIEAIVSIEWQGMFIYDIDMWMRTADGKVVWYNNKEAGSVFLERDDVGRDCNNRYVDTGSLPPTDGFTCEEVIGLRGLSPGEYVLNIHFYAAGPTLNGTTVPSAIVRTKIEKVNPTVELLWRGEKNVTVVSQELHIVRFTITPDGKIGSFTSARPIMLRAGSTVGRTDGHE